uniref:Uncharacterized protein n=1 Tax=Oryza punctata TaxID=4537 RepID=A0A0E0LCX6_ORYPU
MVVTSIPDKIKGKIESQRQCHNPTKKDKEEAQVVVRSGQLVPYIADSNSDSDYLDGDSCSSEEDEETNEIMESFKEFQKKLKDGQVADLDDVFSGERGSQRSEKALPSPKSVHAITALASEGPPRKKLQVRRPIVA